MNQLQIFNYNSNQVRTIVQNGEPWFVLKDVCEVLEISNHRMAKDRLDQDEVSQTDVIDFLGRKQQTNIINESGLYNVILRSDKPNAKPFRKWVTTEVLPTIRKHGAYLTPDVLERTLSDPNYIIGLISALAESKKELAMKDQVIGELKPKADYLDRILKSRSLVTITQIAKDYGMSGVAMNRLLHDKKVQYKLGDQWLLYSEYHDKGFTSSKTIVIEDVPGNEKVVMQTYWTMKGRLFLYNLLLEDGILPVIERIHNDAKQK